MKRVLVNFTKEQLEQIDKLVEAGLYRSRSDVLRSAFKLFLEAGKYSDLKIILGKLRTEAIAKRELLSEKIIEEKIIDILKEKPRGLPVLKIAEVAKLHRNTVTKYLGKLITAGILRSQKIGRTRLCILNKKVPR